MPHSVPFGALRQQLGALASAPDDSPEALNAFRRIVTLAAARIAVVDYASITTERNQAATTVAMSNDLALAVDEAQYADDRGPCLQALGSGRPVAAEDITMTVSWPGFREQAVGLGVRSSLSIPLWGASGRPAAALNVYARAPRALNELAAAITVLFDDEPDAEPERMLDDGSVELLDGLSDAMAIQRDIQVGVGMLMTHHRLTADRAYLMLRQQAATQGLSVPEAARAAYS